VLKNEERFRTETVEALAKELALAARTAPKAKGIDLLEILVLTGEDIVKLSEAMKKIGEREALPGFLRDSENIKKAQAMLLIGTKKKTIGLKYCSFCGFKNCQAAEQAGAICAYNTNDLGVAVGSAVAVAANHRLDNRIMYSVGKTAVETGLLGSEVVVALGIPLSVSGKNPFFDR
jgi:uncharacterized ferredoxin-like protein